MTRICKIVFCLVLGLATIPLATAKLDYSGTYTAQRKGGKAASPKPPVIRVSQSDSSIEITRTEGEKTVTNRMPLDGSEVDYTLSNGIHGRGRVQFKGDDLLIEWLVITPVGSDSKPFRVHTKERWRLSSDKRALTIKSEVDFPDFPPSVTAAALPNNPWTDTYQRTD